MVNSGPEDGSVLAVSSSPGHTMSKPVMPVIRLVENLGVEGDAHSGETVKHRSRVRRDAAQPNLRQVHLIHSELHEELRLAGFDMAAGQMGENITTRGVDLLGLSTGTLLYIGDEAVVRVTGLRNPCTQLDGLQEGLMRAVLEEDGRGNIVRKAGIMAVVVSGGNVRPGDPIVVAWPPGPFVQLAPV